MAKLTHNYASAARQALRLSTGKSLEIGVVERATVIHLPPSHRRNTKGAPASGSRDQAKNLENQSHIDGKNC
jgi:hypothetical protein